MKSLINLINKQRTTKTQIEDTEKLMFIINMSCQYFFQIVRFSFRKEFRHRYIKYFIMAMAILMAMMNGVCRQKTRNYEGQGKNSIHKTDCRATKTTLELGSTSISTRRSKYLQLDVILRRISIVLRNVISPPLF